MKKERNTGIELLRIVAMLAVMILHVLGQGGVLNNAPALSRNYEAAWAMEILCYFGVTAYAIISGYVGLEGNFHYTNIIYLWLQVFFYGVISTVFFVIINPSAVSGIAIKCAVFPIMTESFWYFSAYAGLFFFIPFIKYAVENMPRKYLTILCGGMLLLWSVLPVFFNVDVFGLKNGASFAWIFACFLIGAYVKKFNILSAVKSELLVVIFFGMVILTFLSKYIIEVIYGAARWDIDRANILISYNSPTIFMASLSLVILFSRFNISEKWSKIITMIAPLTFGVYLCNSQPLVWNYIMYRRFDQFTTYPVWKLILCTVCSALVIFFIGICIDAIRNLLFELGHLRQKLRALENYLKL